MFVFGPEKGFLDAWQKDAEARGRQDARNFPMTTEPVVEVSGKQLRRLECDGIKLPILPIFR
jgi:hypothetical protein